MPNFFNRSLPIIIAVDGPAGSGKSTICAEVGRRLGFTYVNTGLIYRAFGLFIQKYQLDFSDEARLRFAVDTFVKAVRWDAATASIFLDGIDVTEILSTNEAGQLASKVAAISQVREALKSVQRDWAIHCNTGAIVDGRDIGTSIFPDANLKVFLTASIEKRAQRRLAQLRQLGVDAANLDLIKVQQEIADRDAKDANRSSSPMVVAKDAVLLDTSDLTKEESIDRLLKMIKELR